MKTFKKMGKLGSELIPFLRENLDNQFCKYLIYEEGSDEKFNLHPPRMSQYITEEEQWLVKEWAIKKKRPYNGRKDYSKNRQRLIAALKRSDYLEFLGESKKIMKFRFKNKDEIADLHLKKIEYHSEMDSGISDAETLSPACSDQTENNLTIQNLPEIFENISCSTLNLNLNRIEEHFKMDSGLSDITTLSSACSDQDQHIINKDFILLEPSYVATNSSTYMEESYNLPLKVDLDRLRDPLTGQLMDLNDVLYNIPQGNSEADQAALNKLLESPKESPELDQTRLNLETFFKIESPQVLPVSQEILWMLYKQIYKHGMLLLIFKKMNVDSDKSNFQGVLKEENDGNENIYGGFDPQLITNFIFIDVIELLVGFKMIVLFPKHVDIQRI